MSQLYGIQVLRAIAAFMVAIHHVQPDAALLAQRAGLSFARSDFLPWMAGVDIFFVVSGFIMVHASERLFGQPGAPRLFLWRRLARIVPLYWATTTLFLLVVLVVPGALNSGVPGLAQIAASYLFWPAVSVDGLIQPVYSLGWTLNYEMLFYAVFAAALALPRPFVLPVVTGVLVLLVAAEVARPMPLPFGFWGQPIVLEFAAGMALAVLHRRGVRCGGAMRLACVVVAVLLLAFGRHLPLAAGPWRDLAIHGPAAVLLVLAAASVADPAAPALPVRWLARLGDASYTLYLVHPFVIRGLRELFARLLPGMPLLFVFVALMACLLAALVTHHAFERPVTQWLRPRLRRRAG